MKEIKDKSRIAQWLRETGLTANFQSQNLQFQAFSYSKGELLTSPLIHLDYILFPVAGSVQIYAIQKDGRIGNIGLVTRPGILGDIEYTLQNGNAFYSEAREDVVCLALPIRKYREELDHDPLFLRMLLESVTRKLVLSSTMEFQVPTVEEKLLFYLHYECHDGVLDGVNTATINLHCSRRQLQRAIRKLCEEGRLVRTGRGQYRTLP